VLRGPPSERLWLTLLVGSDTDVGVHAAGCDAAGSVFTDSVGRHSKHQMMDGSSHKVRMPCILSGLSHWTGGKHRPKLAGRGCLHMCPTAEVHHYRVPPTLGQSEPHTANTGDFSTVGRSF
jgi:hypothetical protein